MRTVFSALSLCLTGLTAVLDSVGANASEPTTSQLFPATTSWRWQRGTNEASVPVTAWRLPEFDDARWAEVPAPFLYTISATEPPFWDGGAFAGTLLGDMAGRYSSIFLRKSFVVTNSVRGLSLTLSAASDDGFIAWVNGVEVARRNVPGGAVPFNGLALTQTLEPVPVADILITNAAGLLRDGANVLAVQAFNATVAGSDFGFMASLALTSGENPPVIAALDPPAGTEVESLTQVIVTFNQPVSGVEAGDLLVNGVPATGLIRDAVSNPRSSRGHETQTLTDGGQSLLTSAATSSGAFPDPGSSRGNETRGNSEFRIPNSEFEMSLLTSPATSGEFAVPLPEFFSSYRFTFAQPPPGLVRFAWAAGHGIVNRAGDPFAGGAWSVTINTNLLAGRPYITEFLADNRGGLSDEDSDSPDWIEIHNPGPRVVSLGGWFLTDSTNRLTKWRFPATSMPINSYLVVFASGKNRTNTTRLHTNFRLQDDGGYLALVRPDGISVASEFHYGRQRKNVSCGVVSRPPSAHRFFSPPTPGAMNVAGYMGLVADTHFSTNRGFFFAPVNVTVWTPTPGATLVTTTDGSEPTLSNGARASGTNATLRLTNTTTLRAAAFLGDWLPTDVDTHTYIFPARVVNQVRPAGASSTWFDDPPGSGAYSADYTVNTEVLSTALPGYSFTNALMALPSVSIVTPVSGLFGSATGLYAHTFSYGSNWERRTSVELIYPDGREGFAVKSALRAHGGVSRLNSATPKHPLRLTFRGEAGPSRLEYALFADSTVKKFDQLVLRACSTDSWPIANNVPNLWNNERASYQRDQWMRDAQIDLGHPSAHGTYVHLYLNGLYWGMYNLTERPTESFASEHFGGDKDDYDVVADYAGELEAGSRDPWVELLEAARRVPTDPSVFTRMQGLNPDGTRNTNFPVLIDMDNFIDYTLLHISVGAIDWPLHNWWAARRRGPESGGFRFFVWDQEIGLASIDRDITWATDKLFEEVDTPETPGEIYDRLRRDAEFRMRFADRVQKHFFNGGVLTVASNRTRWMRRANEIDHAMVGESARWGDAHRTPSFKRETHWLAVRDFMANTYWQANESVALARFRRVNLFPNVNAPILRQHGGLVPADWSLAITNPNTGGGTIYFTTDGSDPRLRGGAVSGRAQAYTAPVALNTHTVVRARVFSGNVWSALVETEFFVPQDYAALRLTEIHYNPPMFGGTDGERFEFLELQNRGAAPLDLSGLTFTDGVDYTFRNGVMLAPGAFCVLVNSTTNFARLWPNIAVHGEFANKLDNGGETVALTHPLGFTVFSIAYDDAPGWPLAADGFGASLNFVGVGTNTSAARDWVAGLPSPGAAFDPAADTDGDRLPDTWELAHGTNARDDDADADPDADGASNWQEFVAGTDPRDMASALRITRIQRLNGDTVELRFTAMPERSYRVEWRPTLDRGEWLEVSTAPATELAREVTVTHTVPNESARFYRLVAP